MGLLLRHQIHKPALHQGVKSAGGFVENQNVGVVHKGGHDSKLLLHPFAHLFYLASGIQFKTFQQLLLAALGADLAIVCDEFQKLRARHIIKKTDFTGNVAKPRLHFIPLGPTVHTINGAGS